MHANERLFGRLDLAFRQRILWLHGPPGAGKTTLAASYLAARAITPLWYRLDEGDADPATVFYYLAQSVEEYGRDAPLQLLTADFRSALPLFTRRFFRDLFAVQGLRVVVFDDYHQIADEAQLHECLPHGLEEVPDGCHIFIVSREGPPPQLARLRLNGLIHVVEPDALRMTEEETAGLARVRGAAASSACVEAITRQTQGWAAGLILMLEAGDTGPSLPARSDAPVPQILFDYFAGEILRRMDLRAQYLLRVIALMPATTAASAVRLTEADDAGSLLEDLRRRNYFTTRDIAAEPLYRFHPLFRDFLLDSARMSLPPEELTTLRVRAAGVLDNDGQPDPAVSLLAEAGAFEALAGLVKRRAAILLTEGRSDTLIAWLAKLPASLIEDDAWLTYWQGAARVQWQPATAFPLFGRAFRLFEASNDSEGEFRAWAGLAEAVRLDSVGDMTRFDALIITLRALLARYPSPLPVALMLPVAAGMAVALARRGSERAEVVHWQKQALAAARALARPQDSLRLGFSFATLDAMDANFATLRETLRTLPDPTTLDHLPIAQSIGLVAHGLALLYRQTTGSFGAFAEDAIRRLEASGLTIWMSLIASFAVQDAYEHGDHEGARIWLRRAETYADRVSPNRGVYCHYVAMQYYVAIGDLASAKIHADVVVSQALEGGWLFFEALARLGRVVYLREAGELDEARAELGRLDRDLARGTSGAVAFSAKLLRADLEVAQGNDAVGRDFLAQAMALGRVQGDRCALLNALTISRIYLLALRFGIETAYVRTLIEASNIRSPDPFEEAWPWPVRISTFGGLDVHIDGEPLAFARKTPKKLIALLKAIVAFGGRSVSEERLMDAVWPDEDGDAARSALRIAIHRLRKLLGGGGTLLVSGERVGLDPTRCWLDIWTIEHLFAQDGDLSDKRAADERIISLYRGDFLVGDDALAWTAPRREEMRVRFARMIRLLATRMSHAEAVDLYSRGLAVAPEAEDLYQGLMRCHLARGEAADGLAIYARLLEILGASRVPAPSSEALMRKLSVC